MPAQPNLFTPAKLGPVTLRNRIIKSATFEAATPDALVTDDLIKYHRLPAAGGVGMTTVAYCAHTDLDASRGGARTAEAHGGHSRRGRGDQRADRPCRAGPACASRQD